MPETASRVVGTGTARAFFSSSLVMKPSSSMRPRTSRRRCSATFGARKGELLLGAFGRPARSAHSAKPSCLMSLPK